MQLTGLNFNFGDGNGFGNGSGDGCKSIYSSHFSMYEFGGVENEFEYRDGNGYGKTVFRLLNEYKCTD